MKAKQILILGTILVFAVPFVTAQTGTLPAVQIVSPMPMDREL